MHCEDMNDSCLLNGVTLQFFLPCEVAINCKKARRNFCLLYEGGKSYSNVLSMILQKFQNGGFDTDKACLTDTICSKSVSSFPLGKFDFWIWHGYVRHT